jgi:hypothetical protein
VLITCVGEVVKHWARRVVTATNPAFDVVAHITCAYDAVTRLDRFANQATIADICRSTLGSLAGAIVLLDETVVVSNEVLDSLDLLYHQSAVVITEPIMLATIACVLPSTGERPEAHGLQTRLTLDGVIDAPDDCALVVNNTARPIRSLPSGSTKRDRSIDGVTGVRAVSTKSSDYGAPAHTAVAPRAWTPLVLPSALFPMLPPMYMPLDYASASTASTTTLLDAAAPLYSSAAPAVAASTTVANSGIAFSPIRSLDSPLEPPAAPQARAPLVSSDPPLGITSGIARLSLHGDEVEPQLQRDAITQHLEPAHTSNSPEPSPRTLDDDGVGNNGDAPAPATLPPIESLLTNPDEILNNFVPVSPTGGIKEEPETSTDVDVEQWLKDAWLKTEAIEPTHPSIQ